MEDLKQDDIMNMATEKVNLGRQLIGELKQKDLMKIAGVQRIHKQIAREVNNLLKATHDGSISFELVNASKLLHLECLVKILLKCRALTSVDYVLPVEESDTDPMRVDIVCENGACSVNVEAKNLQTLNNSLNNMGRQRILNQAEEFVEAATANPEVAKPPQVCLIFDNELDSSGTSKVDDGLMDFVNSIVRSDQNERQWEFQLNNTGQEEVNIEEDERTKSVREYKRVQMQQRRANPVIRSAENDRKRTKRHEKREVDGLGPPRKYQKRTTDEDDIDEHIGDEEEEEDVEEEDREPAADQVNLIGSKAVIKTEISPATEMYELVQVEQEESSYTEIQPYFCEACKETGSAYEQEILRLREELKHKDTIINSLRTVLNIPSSKKVIVTGMTATDANDGN